MRTIALAVAAGALLAATHANAGTFPVNNLTGVEAGLVDQVAVRVYVYEGRRYCFYFDGWHGPGWYRCGFAWRRGFGWGGVYGWNDWNYGPYERRFHGRVHRGDRDRYDRHERRGDRIGVESNTRTRSGIEGRSRTRSTTGVESNTRTRSTTGRGPGADVQSGGSVKMQGVSSGGGNVRGGASGGSSGGGASGGGNAGSGPSVGGSSGGEKK